MTRSRSSNSVKHEKCGGDMVKRSNMFYWRGDWRPGWVCLECRALYAVAGDEIEPLKGTGL